jgi:hypothetical protein
MCFGQKSFSNKRIQPPTAKPVPPTLTGRSDAVPKKRKLLSASVPKKARGEEEAATKKARAEEVAAAADPKRAFGVKTSVIPKKSGEPVRNRAVARAFDISNVLKDAKDVSTLQTFEKSGSPLVYEEQNAAAEQLKDRLVKHVSAKSAGFGEDFLRKWLTFGGKEAAQLWSKCVFWQSSAAARSSDDVLKGCFVPLPQCLPMALELVEY